MSKESMEIKFRDANEIAGFTMVPNVVLTAQNSKLTVQARQIYYVLRHYATMEGGAYPSRKTIAKQCGWRSEKPIKEHLPKLVDFKLITVVPREGSSNQYIIEPITQEIIDMLQPYCLPQYRGTDAPETKRYPGPNGTDHPGPNGTDHPGPNGTDHPGPNGTANKTKSNNTEANNTEINKQSILASESSKASEEEDCLVDCLDSLYSNKQFEKEADEFVGYALKMSMDIRSIGQTKQRYYQAREKGVTHKTLMSELKRAYKQYGKNAAPISVIPKAVERHETEMALEKQREEKREENQRKVNEVLKKAGIDPEQYEVNGVLKKIGIDPEEFGQGIPLILVEERLEMEKKYGNLSERLAEEKGAEEKRKGLMEKLNQQPKINPQMKLDKLLSKLREEHQSRYPNYTVIRSLESQIAEIEKEVKAQSVG